LKGTVTVRHKNVLPNTYKNTLSKKTELEGISGSTLRVSDSNSLENNRRLFDEDKTQRKEENIDKYE